ncbi:tetraacyldisaccharide 4'-kinase [Segetibacter aerophilus]|uniref:Tetraacyldisaccharide 4'-kinase n=1 Tax=Segetibacter aerophilus TaxID=670293 RepID=A0A512B977_9BACT|nr:tetraacyldisaccharide 4'-kinase [Segetibacter aerophilus]GEO08483.1 tetraacyldisaccharide 4'-kinase [Segetibacter aerophilus]
MNFNFYLLKSVRILLFPFSLLYGLVVIIRNYLFDKKIIKSVSFNLPIIGVGNLSVGGTGKSPMVEYLIRMLQDKYQIATLSRGYKRKTKGYTLAHAETTALEIGDEPMQFYSKFPSVAVAVGEERIVAIPQLLHDRPETQVIILDDSFQHRSIHPGFNILLTECGDLFTRDFFLPTGDLRDQKSSYKRANVIVVTKCPPEISMEQAERIKEEIRPLPNQHVLFSTIQYTDLYHIVTKEKKRLSLEDEVLLVCGIANPTPLKNYLVQQSKTYYQLSFSDHHIFTIDDLNEVRKKFEEIQATQKMIVTTEKDAVRLMKFKDELKEMPMYVLPIQHRFLFGRGTQFDEIVNTFIETFQDNKKHEQKR